MTVPSLNEDFEDLLRALLESDVEFLLVGAHALAVHGAPRATGDLDVFVKPTQDNAGRVVDAGNGRPVVGAVVVLRYDAQPNEALPDRDLIGHVELQSDGEGRFSAPRFFAPGLSIVPLTRVEVRVAGRNQAEGARPIAGVVTLIGFYGGEEARRLGVREQAIALGREPVADRLLAELDALHQHRFRVVVIGEFSRGKSTFVNALLGQKLLPAKIRPTTAVLTSVRHGEDPDARVFLAGGHAAKSVPVAELGPVLMGKAEDLGPIQRVELRRPLPTGLEDIELIGSA